MDYLEILIIVVCAIIVISWVGLIVLMGSDDD